MTAKEIKFDQDARQKMLSGIDVLANAAKVTLDRKGRDVVVENEPSH